MKNDIYALDFDGVLCDSVIEAHPYEVPAYMVVELVDI